MHRAIGATLRALVLVPLVFALAIAAVALAVATVPRERAAAGMHPLFGHATPDQSARPAPLIVPLTIQINGGGQVSFTVRVTATPPGSGKALDASRGYVSDILRSMVTELPSDWVPNPQGLAVLRRAIENAVPVALTTILPAGTRVTVEVSAPVLPSSPPRPTSPSP